MPVQITPYRGTNLTELALNQQARGDRLAAQDRSFRQRDRALDQGDARLGLARENTQLRTRELTQSQRDQASRVVSDTLERAYKMAERVDPAQAPGVFTAISGPVLQQAVDGGMAEFGGFLEALPSLTPEAFTDPKQRENFGSLIEVMRGGERVLAQAGNQGSIRIAEGITPIDDTKPVDPSKLRNSFLKETQEFKKQDAAYSRILASASDPSAAGDLALIFNYMKPLDPASTVGEGEFATAQNAGGVDSQVRSLYGRVMDGTRLSEEQREDFVARSRKLYRAALSSNEKLEDQFRSLAEGEGIDPSLVIVNRQLADDPLSPEEQAELDQLRQQQGDI